MVGTSAASNYWAGAAGRCACVLAALFTIAAVWGCSSGTEPSDESAPAPGDAGSEARAIEPSGDSASPDDSAIGRPPVLDAGGDAGGAGTSYIDADEATTPPPTCLLDGEERSEGGLSCCNGDPNPSGACGGCLGEGESCVSGGTACCDLLTCANNACGTNACVWEGSACGGQDGIVCCNDDCNAVTGRCGF